jgi:hypothetical protein
MQNFVHKFKNNWRFLALRIKVHIKEKECFRTKLFFLISKRISLKKRKAPLSTQKVYTEANSANPQKKTKKSPQETHKKTPNKHNRNLHKIRETPKSNLRIQKEPLRAPKPTPLPPTGPPKPKGKQKLTIFH